MSYRHRGETGVLAKYGGTTATTAAGRKQMRDERRVAAKAKRDAKMKSGNGNSAAPASDKAR